MTLPYDSTMNIVPNISITIIILINNRLCHRHVLVTHDYRAKQSKGTWFLRRSPEISGAKYLVNFDPYLSRDAQSMRAEHLDLL